MINLIDKNKSVLRIVAFLIFGIVLLAPGFVFFENRGGFGFLEGSDWKTLDSLFFPLFGLYGFTLIWLQIMIGSNMRYFVRLWPKTYFFHQFEGITTFIVVFTHVFLVIQTYTFSKFIGFEFVPENQKVFALLGSLAFDLLIISTTAALLRRNKLLIKNWRYFHYLNYLIFFIVFIHSWNLGSDIQHTVLRYFWLFAFVTVVLSLGIKIWKKFNPFSDSNRQIPQQV